MQKIIYVLLLSILLGCSSDNQGLIISPLKITIEEDNIKLKLDKEGVIYQDEIAIGKINNNQIEDLTGSVIFSLSDDYILFDLNKDTIEDLRDKRTFIDDGMWLDLKWSDSGELLHEDGGKPGIQVLPNDSTLYRTASTILLFAERMKK